MKLYIKNMVCQRCKVAVQSELEKLGLNPISVELGEVELATPLSTEQKSTINQHLQQLGFELIDDKKQRTIHKIKTLIIELVHQRSNDLSTNLSDYLARQLLMDYHTLSHLFSEVENTTIEKYYILQKIEKVKELLVYDELSLSEIALQLHYSSVSHLSRQFKQVTGFTPTHFKNLKNKKRNNLDEV